MLSNIKMLLGIEDNTQDSVILLYKDIITQKVLNYCNREDVPVELELILVEIISNEYRKVTRQRAIEDGAQKGVIESIKRGGMQINYATDSVKAESADLLSDYKDQLDKFKLNTKKVRFI